VTESPMFDLRTVLVGLITGVVAGIITYYVTKRIDRYLAQRTIRGRRLRIEELTQQLELLEKLGTSDRSLLLFAFRMLFPTVALGALGLAGVAALSLVAGPSYSLIALVVLAFCMLIVVLAAYASSVFQKLDDPEPTLEKLRDDLRKLRAADDQSAQGSS
jgi:uncharacterized membrane protein